ncbi:hypothetical protein MtrunA17_Chr6g0487901 [Medicago truncatula]|uniref:Transmembrane protein n=1 Tax=Medicago truncatula TaxID=3880 RepID=A0A396HIG3_MEDTR|nr:hypothetical protein MtrunA17_Chr6g0487901 [Medicago truncatula]
MSLGLLNITKIDRLNITNTDQFIHELPITLQLFPLRFFFQAALIFGSVLVFFFFNKLNMI